MTPLNQLHTRSTLEDSYFCGIAACGLWPNPVILRLLSCNFAASLITIKNSVVTLENLVQHCLLLYMLVLPLVSSSMFYMRQTLNSPFDNL